jgi:hypothetical protein
MQDRFLFQIQPVSREREGRTPTLLHAKHVDIEIPEFVEQGLGCPKIEVIEGVHWHF